MRAGRLAAPGELEGFHVFPLKSSNKLHSRPGKPLNILFQTNNILATKIYEWNLDCDQQCMCFSEKSSFVSDAHQEPKQHEAFQTETIIPMPSA